ncbi:hypothetical protein [Geodermatophilus amargosae]|uniref:hypothetical protein n=1 Tax=Geodermatophilus amargosae TaxID=1296565 RepID=UPI0034E00E41
MTSPSFDKDTPQGGQPHGQQQPYGQPYGQPHGLPHGQQGPGPAPYGGGFGGPSPYGGGAPAGRRPGTVTAAAVIGIVWGGLGTLFGLLALGVAFAISGLLGLVLLLSTALSVGLLVGGISVLNGRPPKLLLVISYVAIAINVISLVVSLASSGGSAFNGVLGFILPGIVIALLVQPASKQYFAARGQSY